METQSNTTIQFSQPLIAEAHGPPKIPLSISNIYVRTNPTRKQNHTLLLTSHIPTALKRSLKLQLIKLISHFHQLQDTTMNFTEGMKKTKYGN